MSQTWVAGYEVAFSLDADTVIALTAERVSINKGSNPITKRLLGAEDAIVHPGQSSGSFSASGVGSQEALPKLFELEDPTNAAAAVIVTFWSSGDTAAFDIVVTDVQVEAEADGDITWSVSGDIDGDVTYTEV